VSWHFRSCDDFELPGCDADSQHRLPKLLEGHFNKKKGRSQITHSFRDIISASENCESIAREIIIVLVFMDTSESLAAIAMWQDLMQYIDHFTGLKRDQRRQVPVSTCPLGSPRFRFAQYSRQSISLRYPVGVEPFALASHPITFEANNQEIHPHTMLACQELIEVFEVKQLVHNQGQRALEEVLDACFCVRFGSERWVSGKIIQETMTH
jgi:hypothetical protein